MDNRRLTLIIAAVAVVSIVAVLVSQSGGDGDDEPADRTPQSTEQVQSAEPEAEGPEAEEPEPAEVPDNPDDVRGSDSFSLIHSRNFGKALAVLERRRQKVEGVFDGLRLAPGRIDTTIIHPDDRMTNIQVRPDLEISSSFTHDFPTQPDFRKGGLSGREVDTAEPQQLLRQFDEQRSGSSLEDVDYCVISKDIIDFRVNISCYMRIRTARPRAFLKEAGEPLRVIG